MKAIQVMETISRIADRAECKPTTISNIINGRRRPSWKLAKRLAEVTGTKPELWLDGTPEQIKTVLNNIA